jgi:excisionase family DNA binding protein
MKTENLSFDRLPEAVSQLSYKLEKIERLLLEQNPAKATDPQKLLNADEASQFLNLSKATIYSKCSLGELPYIKRGRLYFDKSELLKFIKSGRQKTNEEIKGEALSHLKIKGGVK